MLLTTCTNCGAQFRVIPDQLNIRQGRVMCGRCRYVFNAFESLKRVPDETPLPATAPVAAGFATPQVADAAPHNAGATPRVATDRLAADHFAAAHRPTAFATSAVSAPTAAPTPAPTSATLTPSQASTSAEPVSANAITDDALEQLARLEREFAERDRELERQRLAALPTSESPTTFTAPIATTRLPDLDDESVDALATPTPETTLATLRAPIRYVNATRVEPTSAPNNRGSSVQDDEITIDAESAQDDYDTDEERQTALLTDNALINPPQPTRAWIWLTLLLLATLMLQIIFFFRSEIVQRFPDTRPALVAACDLLKCSVPWGRVEGAVRVDQYDLIEPPGRPGKMLLTATLVNRGATKQDFPNIELKLTDTSEAVLSSRVLTPPEYLGRIPSTQEGINPNAELYINLSLELAGKTPASGFSLRPFYP